MPDKRTNTDGAKDTLQSNLLTPVSLLNIQGLS